MVEVLGKKPWTLRAQGTVLADLHRRLHLIPAPDWLRSLGTGAPRGRPCSISTSIP